MKIKITNEPTYVDVADLEPNIIFRYGDNVYVCLEKPKYDDDMNEYKVLVLNTGDLNMHQTAFSVGSSFSKLELNHIESELTFRLY